MRWSAGAGSWALHFRPPPPPTSHLYIAAMAQPAKSVLWVDDEAELLEPHRIFLRDKGFEVETVTNADDAVEMVRRRPFDLVLLDEQMPGTRGLEALPSCAKPIRTSRS